jgi:hypothetical protein
MHLTWLYLTDLHRCVDGRGPRDPQLRVHEPPEGGVHELIRHGRHSRGAHACNIVMIGTVVCRARREGTDTRYVRHLRKGYGILVYVCSDYINAFL